ncbi:MAG TPA: ABC transporter ATP-binding protein, partial [Microbacterium sp.]|nr:ABC transporter ATP-binding protein [Microbacterium sp.]
RLIEPTSGVIELDGRNIMGLNANELRRHIGYVIQQIGLFPHMTIAENIAVVPKLLGWSRSRISERVDELLHTVQLDPGIFAGRYPKELSGGQQQRVGVARALAADPPVMLMDEPFGATDPITRERLQLEFLRLKETLGKTIIFVTHDFDEALKLGDRIAVLSQRSRIEQVAPPADILAAPANEYVTSFIGRAATIKRLGLMPVTSVMGRGSDVADTLPASASALDALDLLVLKNLDAVGVVDDAERVLGVVTVDSLSDAVGSDIRDVRAGSAAESRL